MMIRSDHRLHVRAAVPRYHLPSASRGKPIALLLAAATWASVLAASSAVALPQGFLDELVTGGLTAPTALAPLPDGRLIVTEQGGRAKVVVDGVVRTTPLVTLNVDAQGERGLVGVAVHPDFARNGFVYFYHTVPATTNPPAAARNRITRFTVRGNEADPASATTILVLDALSTRTNHNGGGLVFGRDGKLYVSVGDAGTGTNAQSLATRHGKVLRLNDNGSIPADNPQQFAGIAGSPLGDYRAIWAVGLRNPFRLAVHPHTGRIFINDVGENRLEEINDGRPAANYGWPASEGPTTLPDIDQPVYSYAHSGGSPTGCAITGGAFYNVTSGGFPAGLNDKYFFADYCGDWIYYVDPASPGTASPFHSGLNGPVDLAVGPDGALYYAQAGNGQVRRIRYNGASAQGILLSVNRLDVAEGQSAQIAVRLANAPAVDATVSMKLAYADPTLQLSPATLTFGPGNWDVSQNVTVSVAQDGDGRDEAGRIDFTMANLTPVSSWITTVDDDRPANAPRAIISRPRAGETVKGANAEFFGDGRDGGKIVRAEFYVNNVLRFTDVNDSSHFHIGGDHNMWNTTLLPNGYYIVRLRVIDENGVAGSQEVKIRIVN